MEFAFEKGNEVSVCVNGVPLGGVIKLQRTAKRLEEGFFQFLTDKPVAKTESCSYELELWLRCAGGCALENTVNSLSVSDADKTEIYTLCTVKRVESTAQAQGEVEYHAVISAAERSVLVE